MKKLVTVFLALGLFSQQGLAASVTESVTGETFAGYANSVVGKNGSFLTDLGNSTSGPNWSTNSSDINARITDTSAGSNIVGASDGAWIDLGFDMSVVDGVGNDLKLFFVGNNGHKVDVTIGGVTQTYTLGPGANATGFFDPAYPEDPGNPTYPGDPIIALGIDLSTFSGLSGSAFNSIRLMVGNGYCDDSAGPCSAVPSFVGTYNTAVVPVPAAVWLFGSGLVGLAGVIRRRR